MTDIPSNNTPPEAPQKKKMSRWKIGCGIGCGGILLIFIIIFAIGYSLIKDSVTAFVETGKSMKLITETYGNVHDYCPPPDGTIEPDRAAAFLDVRESMIPIQKDMNDSIIDVIEKINRAEEEGESFGNVVGIIKDVSKVLPKLAQYFTARNRKLMDVHMGLGEYFYIYVTAYYGYLGLSPEDGPDFHFLGGGTKNSSFYFAMQEMLKDKDKDKDKKEEEPGVDPWETEGVGSIARVRGFFLPMMECLLKKLNENTAETDETRGSLRNALETEIEALRKNRRRIPWQDGLPTALQASLKPFEERLKTSYSRMTNPLEFGLYKR